MLFFYVPLEKDTSPLFLVLHILFFTNTRHLWALSSESSLATVTRHIREPVTFAPVAG